MSFAGDRNRVRRLTCPCVLLRRLAFLAAATAPILVRHIPNRGSSFPGTPSEHRQDKLR